MTPEETEFQSGRVEGGTYTNEFLSVACQLGDEWTYLTDEEIAQLNGCLLYTSHSFRSQVNPSSMVSPSPQWLESRV